MGTRTIYNEMVCEVNHGAPWEPALTAAIQTHAARLDRNSFETIAAGREGDVVAMAGNPRVDIHALSDLRVVACRGRVIRATGKAGDASNGMQAGRH